MNKQYIFDRLMAEIGNAYGVCGLMGNLQAESNFRPKNMQNSYEAKLGFNDETYTEAVDNNTYLSFQVDRVGFGIAQWTSEGRKTNLWIRSKETGKSIGDLDFQIDFIIWEMVNGYKSVLNTLKNATSVREASDIVTLKYEAPGSVGKNATPEQRQATLDLRASYGEALYKEFVKEEESKEEIKDDATMKKKVCIDAGHYGKYNQCPGIPEYYESEIMWKLHLLQKKHLEALGIEVVTTRSNQSKDLSLATRGKKADGCDLFISNHSNAVAGGMNENIDHVAVYHLTDDTTTNADNISAEIAKIIAPIIAGVMGTKGGFEVLTRKSGNDRNGDGMLNDNYYAVLHGARLVNVPGLILEHSFHTNTNAVKWLLNDANLDKLARAEAEAIAAYLKRENGAETEEKTEHEEKPVETVFAPYLAKITASSLDVKAGAGDSYKTKTSVKKGEVFTIVEEKDGWGKLKSGAGWINLNGTDKAKTAESTTKAESASGLPYKVKITANALNIRAGAGIQYKINGCLTDDEKLIKSNPKFYFAKGIFTIVEEVDGWGKLKSGAGWIKLSYTEKC